MKQPSIVEGIITAVLLIMLCLPIWICLSIVFPFGVPLSFFVAGTVICYFAYLLRRFPHRPGKLALGVLACGAVAAATLLFSLPFVVLAAAGFLWLLRSFLRYRAVVSSVLDFILVAFGLFASLLAAAHTGSVVLALWCFFLIQALFCLIPVSTAKKKSARSAVSVSTPENRFERAFSSAEQALRRLA